MAGRWTNVTDLRIIGWSKEAESAEPLSELPLPLRNAANMNVIALSLLTRLNA